MADVLLINPPHPGEFERFAKLFLSTVSFPPLGILYLAQWLQLHGYEVEVLDLAPKRIKKSEFLALLEKENPRMVGISVVTEKYTAAVEMARIVKAWNPETVVVVGGPHVSVMDEEALETGVVDIVVRGEGEMTLLELAERLLRNRGRLLDLIAGITYITNGKIHSNPDRPFLHDLDTLPFPAWSLLDFKDYTYPASLISSRGCPGRCVFCAARALSGYTYRARSAENVVAEMRYIRYALGHRGIGVSDDTMVSLPKRITAICNYLVNSHFDARWGCESRVDTVSPELLELMARAGCSFIQFGVETGDQKVLDSLRKGITIEQVRNAVKWAYERGMYIECYFMVGHHTDTVETMEKTILFAKELVDNYKVGIRVSRSIPYPGTYIYDHADELGVSILSRNWDDYTFFGIPVIKTPSLSREDIQNAFSEISHLKRRGRASSHRSAVGLEKSIHEPRGVGE
jgi:anaerobic magnesium-protoporphyrin IX monomethyl ester cyclase